MCPHRRKWRGFLPKCPPWGCGWALASRGFCGEGPLGHIVFYQQPPGATPSLQESLVSFPVPPDRILLTVGSSDHRLGQPKPQRRDSRNAKTRKTADGWASVGESPRQLRRVIPAACSLPCHSLHHRGLLLARGPEPSGGTFSRSQRPLQGPRGTKKADLDEPCTVVVYAIAVLRKLMQEDCCEFQGQSGLQTETMSRETKTIKDKGEREKRSRKDTQWRRGGGEAGGEENLPELSRSQGAPLGSLGVCS